MTTIAIDKFGTIAADGQRCLGDELHDLRHRKIICRPAEGSRPARVFALAGAGSLELLLIEWYEAGHDPKVLPQIPSDTGWTLVIIEPTGTYYVPSNLPFKTRVTLPYAFGSGANYALGILKDGQSAHRSVEVACEIDLYSGGEIQVVNIAEALGIPRLEAAE